MTDTDFLANRRAAAAQRAASLSLPQFKGRAGWEFTDLGKLDLGSYSPAGEGTGRGTASGALFDAVDPSATLAQEDAGAAEVVRGDLPDGVTLLPLDVAAAEHPELVQRHLGSVVTAQDDVFVARNDAQFSGGVFVHVAKDVVVEKPILVTAVQSQDGSALDWRTLIVLEENAQAEVWEQFVSADAELDGLFNTVTELVVGQASRLRYVCGQDLNERSWIFGAQRAEVQRDASLDWVALGFGSARGHVRMETKLAGAGADAKVTGAYASHGRQHVDFDTTQEHAAEHTTSDLAFRGVLDGRSSSVWRGMIKVDPGAQQTDAFQESRNLLLSKKAHADAIPGLEIEADDVRCTHAAAIAQIDAEQLFYLMSRGMRRPAAMRLVIEGFMAELVGRFEDGPVRDVLAGALEQRLSAILDVA